MIKTNGLFSDSHDFANHHPCSNWIRSLHAFEVKTREDFSLKKAIKAVLENSALRLESSLKLSEI